MAALAVFPDKNWEFWHRYGNGKFGSKDRFRFPEACKQAINGIAFTCIPDEGFWDLECVGAGLHLMPAGVSLGSHKDATHSAQRPWRRTGSLVYFLNDCEGGELVVEGEVIQPQANMAVQFPGSLRHEVKEAATDRYTLSLFSYVVDSGEKRTISAQFD